VRVRAISNPHPALRATFSRREKEKKVLRATDPQPIADRQPSKTAGDERVSVDDPQVSIETSLIKDAKPAQMVSPAKDYPKG